VQLFTGVLPGYAVLLSLEQIVAASREHAEFDNVDGQDFDDDFISEDGSAGEPAFRFLRSWVPIAEDGTACTMFVDCRPGDRYGCVTRYEREDFDADGAVPEKRVS
jgi:hypothetical protein